MTMINQLNGSQSRLVEEARTWVVTNYPYNRHHLVRALEWLDRVAPNSKDSVRLAVLTHDMERAFPGPDQLPTKLVDPDYERAHAERSARIVSAWLRDQGAHPDLVRDTERLVMAHEVGGWPEADLVQAADSLSFLETNVDLFLGFVRSGQFSVDEVRRKFRYSYDRIRLPEWQALAAPLLAEAEAKLDAVEASLPAAPG